MVEGVQGKKNNPMSIASVHCEYGAMHLTIHCGFCKRGVECQTRDLRCAVIMDQKYVLFCKCPICGHFITERIYFENKTPSAISGQGANNEPSFVT